MWGFRAQGFRVQGYRVSPFRLQGLDSGFRVQGVGLKLKDLRVPKLTTCRTTSMLRVRTSITVQGICGSPGCGNAHPRSGGGQKIPSAVGHPKP